MESHPESIMPSSIRNWLGGTAKRNEHAPAKAEKYKKFRYEQEKLSKKRNISNSTASKVI